MYDERYQERFIVCDIDGTVANMVRRVPKMPDWNAVHEDIENDPPYQHVIDLLRALSVTYRIVFLTGRPARFMGGTKAWFRKMDVGFHGDVLMRPDDDYAKDPDLKWKLICGYFGSEEIVRQKVFMVIEDRDLVVEMWRNKGLFCIQPRLGDY